MKKGYVVVFCENVGNQCKVDMVDCIAYDLDKLLGIVKKHILDLKRDLSECDTSGIYMLFGGKCNKVDIGNMVAEYYVQEMRTNNKLVEYKIFEIGM